MSLNNMSNGLPQKKQISVPVFIITIVILIVIFAVTLGLVIWKYQKTIDEMSVDQTKDVTILPSTSPNDTVDDISTFVNEIQSKGNYTITNLNSTTE